MMGFEVRKAHLDLFALITGCGELGRAHQRTGVIAGFLILIARDLAGRRVRTTLRLERADPAVASAGTVAHNMVGADAACGREQLAGGADIEVAVAVEGEVGTREGAVVAAALIPDWDVRRDAGFDQPAEELAGALGRIGDEALGP